MRPSLSIAYLCLAATSRRGRGRAFKIARPSLRRRLLPRQRVLHPGDSPSVWLLPLLLLFFPTAPPLITAAPLPPPPPPAVLGSSPSSFARPRLRPVAVQVCIREKQSFETRKSLDRLKVETRRFQTRWVNWIQLALPHRRCEPQLLQRLRRHQLARHAALQRAGAYTKPL
jgi:hypothetical protein